MRTNRRAEEGVPAEIHGAAPDAIADPTIIFLHIGKTAGTTLRRILRRNFRRSEVMLVRIHGAPREETLQDFARLSEKERARPRLLMGHTVFGIHELVPRPSVYVTMVRRPKSLVLSQYSYVLRTPGHRHHEVVRSSGFTLEEYIQSGISLEMDNSQTRAIAGDIGTPFGDCTDEMLERAKENIERHFAAVGITERFDESVVLMRDTLGLTKICYVRANVAPSAALRAEQSEHAIRLIDEHNRLDNELYRYVSERIEGTIASDPEFGARLARYRRANSWYSLWGNLTYAIPQRLVSRLRRAGLVAKNV